MALASDRSVQPIIDEPARTTNAPARIADRTGNGTNDRTDTDRDRTDKRRIDRTDKVRARTGMREFYRTMFSY